MLDKTLNGKMFISKRQKMANHIENVEIKALPILDYAELRKKA